MLWLLIANLNEVRLCFGEFAKSISPSLRGGQETVDVKSSALFSVFKSVFVPVLTCGHESCEMAERAPSQVQAAKMRVLRWIDGATFAGEVHSCDSRKSLNVEPLLWIERSKLRWTAHVTRRPQEASASRFLLPPPLGYWLKCRSRPVVWLHLRPCLVKSWCWVRRKRFFTGFTLFCLLFNVFTHTYSGLQRTQIRS